MKSNFELINDLIDILIWPSVGLIVLFVLKKPIVDLFARIRKIGSDRVAVEVDSPNKQKVDDNEEPINLIAGLSNNEKIENALKLFDQSTLELFSNAIKNETNLEAITNSDDREKTLFRYSQALYIILHFNKIYNAIYGSQLRILQILNGSTKETTKSMKFLYDIARDHHPKFYENYDYHQYLNFLKSYDLITIGSSDKLDITIIGRDFLKYVIESGSNVERLY